MRRTTQVIVETIETECRQRGWNVAELERQAGIARGTFYRMKRGETATPRASTLRKIADALEMDVDDLFRSARPPHRTQSGPSAGTIDDDRRTFDRATNPVVDEVVRERPRLFAGWSPDEWDELYSSFGTGGQLSASGVRTAAEAINQKRETVHRLHVVLETHLRDVAIEMVDTLFRMVQARGNGPFPEAMRPQSNEQSPPGDRR